jgi:hypothetical protein
MRHAMRWVGLFALCAIGLLLTGFAAPAAAATTHTLSLLALGGGAIMGSTIGTPMLTFSDYAKQLGPNNKIAHIIDLLSQQNEILDDAIATEGNLPTGNRTTVLTGLPSVVYRLANQGVPPSKATTAQLDEMCARLEAWSEIDEMIAELAPDLGQFRLNQATPFLEAMNQQMASSLFYGNAGLTPEQFTGLAVRYSSTTAGNGGNILKAPSGSGGDNTSIWLVNWHPQTVHLIYPQNTVGGLQHSDLGKGVIETTTANNAPAANRMMGYRDQYVWRVGLAVEDWRSVVRIANIDTSDLLADTAGATVKLIEYMSRAIDRIQGPRGNLVFYANRTVKSILRVQALNKSTNALAIQDALNQFGKDRVGGTLSFLGIPVRTVDALLPTEALIT